MDLWFYGFMILCFLIGFYGFMVYTIYKQSISCFQEYIELVSMIFEISKKQFTSNVGARLFEDCQTNEFPNFLESIKGIF